VLDKLLEIWYNIYGKRERELPKERNKKLWKK
jgi:hypothetical protein